MTKCIACLAVGLAVAVSTNAFAAERTVTLAVQNMFCAACPHTVKASLQAVAGVGKVTVSLKDKTAIVDFDDAKTNVKALTAATKNAGYPSAPKS
jgi:periplasmic mercuric ion binding protein